MRHLEREYEEEHRNVKYPVAYGAVVLVAGDHADEESEPTPEAPGDEEEASSQL